MSKYLSEPEAWREIARRIAEGRWDRLGLCHETAVLRWGERIHGFTEAEMRRRIRYHLKLKYWAYPAGTAASARILAALWLALEAEEDDA